MYGMPMQGVATFYPPQAAMMQQPQQSQPQQVEPSQQQKDKTEANCCHTNQTTTSE